jgi:hypothetical protein
MTKWLPARRVICQVVLRTPLPDEVEHHLGTPPVRDVEHLLDVAAVDHQSLVGARVARELQRRLVGVEHDDRRGCQRPQALDADVTEPTRADNDAGAARVQQRGCLLDGVVRRKAGIRQRRDVCGLGIRGKPDKRPSRRAQQVRHAAIAVDARERARVAVHIVAGPARPAEPAGGQRVQDHSVAGLHVSDRRAHLADPTSVLVPERVRQPDATAIGPLSLDDVQVGSTKPRPTDLDDHVVRPLDARLGNVLDDGTLVVAVQANGLHGDLPRAGQRQGGRLPGVDPRAR